MATQGPQNNAYALKYVKKLNQFYSLMKQMGRGSATCYAQEPNQSKTASFLMSTYW